jgi:hypothetical protein
MRFQIYDLEFQIYPIYYTQLFIHQASFQVKDSDKFKETDVACNFGT